MRVPSYFLEALKYLDVYEYAGGKHHPDIIAFHQATSLRASDDETAWCSSFMNKILKDTDFEVTNSALAKSWLHKLNECDPDNPFCIHVYTRYDSTGKEVGGHVGINMGHDGRDSYWILGGNQDNQVGFKKYLAKNLVKAGWPRPLVLDSKGPL